jgi:two-component system sensor histidine kinase SenX3
MTRRQKAIGFFITLCVLLVAAAVLLNIYWIVITEKQIVELLVGILLFALIIAGIIVYTVFLVMEIHRNEEHDTFINAVTHELKTPLASIRLYLDTLKTRPVADAQRQQFYDVMLADVDRLRHTVDQVLKAGVVREKQRAAIRTPLDMGLLARECVDLAVTRHHLQPGAIALEAHDGGSLLVRGDAEELRTVITNLLDNAVKYSSGDVRVTVSLAAPAPDTIWVRVQDRGVGIPRKQLKRIFNRFYRVQARGIRQVKGTGLGLYIVRTIARAHGGRVFAQSEGEGRGATFTVELPRITS